MHTLSITLLLSAKTDPIMKEPIRIHKIVEIDFPPFIGLTLSHDADEWEFTLNEDGDLLYSVDRRVFYYSLRKIYSIEAHRTTIIESHIKEGWKEGDGHNYIKTQGVGNA